MDSGVEDLIGSRYRVTGKLGEGGMGILCRAVDEELHRPVAIKILPPAVRADADRLVRFKNEARALGHTCDARASIEDGGPAGRRLLQVPEPVPGLDQVDVAPRLVKPVLMVNGRYDATFPLDAAQDPLFRMLGTPVADKRHVVFDTPHDVRLRRADLIKEVLAWDDKDLGEVN